MRKVTLGNSEAGLVCGFLLSGLGFPQLQRTERLRHNSGEGEVAVDWLPCEWANKLTMKIRNEPCLRVEVLSVAGAWETCMGGSWLQLPPSGSAGASARLPSLSALCLPAFSRSLIPELGGGAIDKEDQVWFSDPSFVYPRVRNGEWRSRKDAFHWDQSAVPSSQKLLDILIWRGLWWPHLMAWNVHKFTFNTAQHTRQALGSVQVSTCKARHCFWNGAACTLAADCFCSLPLKAIEHAGLPASFFSESLQQCCHVLNYLSVSEALS